MNVKRVNAAADLIEASMKRGKRLPVSFAYDLEAACLLQSPETADEIRELKAGVAVADELYREWQRRAETAEARVAELEAVLGTHRKDDRAEIEQLRARVAELEAATYVAPSPSCTRCYGADAARFVAKGGAVAPCRVCGPSQVEQLQARVAELEQLLADGPDRTADADPIVLVPTPAADALDLRREESVRKMRELLGRQREDRYESPLHHDYKVPHDLPEPGVRP